MRNILTILSILLCYATHSYAVSPTYYVSASGNDANNGTSQATAWQTLDKVNAMMSTFAPGDNILLRRGDTFYGSLIINQSGNSLNPITFGAYGTGAKPIITGFTTVTSWTNLGSNIWESTSAVTSLSTLNMVVVNGKNTPMGRWPNSGWVTYESASGNTSITSSALTGTPNWTGAQAVIRKYTWIIDPVTISSQSGSTLNLTNSTSYAGVPNNGFFIQNDARTLDSQNEWYFNPSTKKLRIYSTATPSGVQVPSIETIISVTNQANFIVLDNLSITGANYASINIDGGTTVQNCDIDFSGNYGITTNAGTFAQTFTINNNTINHCNNMSIGYFGRYPVNITNNTIKNSGMIVGASPGADGNGIAVRVDVKDPAVNIAYNRIDSSGYVGIDFKTGRVHHNHITNFDFIKQDGSAIYTSTGDKNTFIDYNIISGGHGDQSGMAPTVDPENLTFGIYFDYMSSKATARYNTISDITGSAFHNNDPDSLTLLGNTTFDISNAAINTGVLTRPYKGANYKYNIFCVPDTYRSSVYLTAHIIDNDLTAMGSIDSNYLVMANASKVSNVEHAYAPYSYNVYDLTYWNNTNHNDIHSSLRVISMDSLRLETNPSASPKTVTLDANYIDVRNVSYNGTITLQPYTSAVLIKNGNIVIDPIPSQVIKLHGNFKPINR